MGNHSNLQSFVCNEHDYTFSMVNLTGIVGYLIEEEYTVSRTESKTQRQKRRHGSLYPVPKLIEHLSSLSNSTLYPSFPWIR